LKICGRRGLWGYKTQALLVLNKHLNCIRFPTM
jgi:hypothetical protein